MLSTIYAALKARPSFHRARALLFPGELYSGERGSLARFLVVDQPAPGVGGFVVGESCMDAGFRIFVFIFFFLGEQEM